jgi:L-ascorbate metabolism protein UlaG (beta-lactamase superfamily)
MKYTYYGHSCFGIEMQGKHILFDPFISGNELANDIDIRSIRPDYILLSHGHSDHVADAITIAKQSDATIIAAYEVAVWAGNQGVKYHPMNIGGKWNFDFGTVKSVVAIHSSVLPDGTYGGNPMGFVLTSGDTSFYYSGDTALTLDMQLIPKYKPLSFAVLCIGDNFTMGPEDAMEAAKMIGCKTIMGVHFNTFGYIKIDKEITIKSFNSNGLNLILPEIGESIML